MKLLHVEKEPKNQTSFGVLGWQRINPGLRKLNYNKGHTFFPYNRD